MNLGLRSSETAETHQTKTLEIALVDTKNTTLSCDYPVWGALREGGFQGFLSKARPGGFHQRPGGFHQRPGGFHQTLFLDIYATII